jgi:hypothetical protein
MTFLIRTFKKHTPLGYLRPNSYQKCHKTTRAGLVPVCAGRCRFRPVGAGADVADRPQEMLYSKLRKNLIKLNILNKVC